MYFFVLRLLSNKKYVPQDRRKPEAYFHRSQDTLLVKLKKRCFRFKDKNKLTKSLKENKAIVHKDYVAKYIKSTLAWKRKLFEKDHEAEIGRTETIENLESTETQRYQFETFHTNLFLL